MHFNSIYGITLGTGCSTIYGINIFLFVCTNFGNACAGGDNQRWQKRYFVLKGSSVQYYKLETDADQKKPRGSIDLTKACGVRKRSQCHEDVEWPKSAAEEASFGVATETRTWYIFADSKSLAK